MLSYNYRPGMQYNSFDFVVCVFAYANTKNDVTATIILHNMQIHIAMVWNLEIASYIYNHELNGD